MPILAEGKVQVARDVIFRAGLSLRDDVRLDTDIINFEDIIIDKITFFNNIITQQTVILSLRTKFGDFRKLRQFKLMIDESGEYLQGGELLPLHAGDELDAETNTADAVDFVVCGKLA